MIDHIKITEMKNLIFGTFLAIVLLFSACRKESINRFGFDTLFNKSSQGLTIMRVDKNNAQIKLTGEVVVNEGGILIELIDPTGETAYFGHFLAPNVLNVNELFNALPGNWKLKYSSVNGMGSLKLHLITFD